MAIAFASGVGKLFDNSFLTHLSTGRLIWDGEGFPRTDAYTFTASGEAWFPQSWFASVVYGGLERIGDATALRLHFGLMMAAIGALAWRLTRPAGPTVRRVLAVAPLLATTVFLWTHRPYLLAFAALAACLLVAEGALDRRWLLVAGWVWLNSHGSWPLGLAALVALWIGARLDRSPATDEIAALRWFAGGLALGVLNPYGVEIMLFPLVALERREVFSQIQEWRPPDFDGPGELSFLVVVAVALLALRRAPSWRFALPGAGFVLAAFLSARNIPVATLVLLPLTARGLRGTAPAVPPLLVRAGPVLATAVLAVAAVVATDSPGFSQTIYPVDVARELDEHGLGPLDARWVTQDFVGNWLEWRHGAEGQVFIDDRFELVPVSVVEDYLVLKDGEDGWEQILERYDAEVVVWQEDRPLAELLESSPCWEVAVRGERFVAAVPASQPCADL